MKTKLDLVDLGRVVRGAWVEYCQKTGRTNGQSGLAPFDELDSWTSQADIYIGGHVADYVEAKLNERAAGRIAELDAEVERLKSEGKISDSPETWLLEKTETINELLKLKDSMRFPHWWYLALVAVSALTQIAYNIAKLNESRVERNNQERLEQLERNV